MLGMGVDPTSGKFGALTRRSYLDQARDEAIAANLARRGEKERVSGLTAQGIQLADPRIASSIGLGLQQSRTGLLSSASDIAAANARIQEAKAGILGGFAQNVVNPFGSIGFGLLGQQIGSGIYGGGGYSPPPAIPANVTPVAPPSASPYLNPAIGKPAPTGAPDPSKGTVQNPGFGIPPAGASPNTTASYGLTRRQGIYNR